MKLAKALKTFLVLVYIVGLLPEVGTPAIPPQHELDLTTVVPVSSARKPLQKEDVARVIPLNLQPGSQDETIAIRIVDHSVNTFFQGDYFRNTELGKAAKGVEQALNTNIDLGGDPQEGEVQHNINFQLLAFEQKAYVKYSGFTDLRMNYLIGQADIQLEMTQAIGGGTTLVLQHHSHDSLSRVNMMWNW